MDKILVHICCGVDSVWALRKLREDYPDAYIEGFFYDPNIHPEEEYELRWIETKRVCNSLGINCTKGEYDLENWFNAVKGYENEPERGERCSICHDLRLEKTAQLAVEKGFNKFTTVLMMSPKKDFDVLKKIGEDIAEKYNLQFLAVDFRKNNGTQKMNQLAKEHQLYHQNYCGCIYGLFSQRKVNFQSGSFIPELVSFSKGRLAGSREELLFIKQIRLFAEELGLKVEEQQFRFLGWRVISSRLQINKQDIKHNIYLYSDSIKGVLNDRVKSIIGNKIILEKSDVEILITEDNIDMEPRFTTNPIFILNKKDIQGINIEKLTMELTTEFIPSSKSQNLYIGDIYNASEIIKFYSDTDFEGKNGYSLKEINDTILQNKENIKEGKTAVTVFGANFFGKIGENIFKHLSGQNSLLNPSDKVFC